MAPASDSRNPVPRLEAWRLWRNMTQRDLARDSGLALSTVNEIETGKRAPRPATLRRLAAALGTEEWNLFNPPTESFALAHQVEHLLDRLDWALNRVLAGGSNGTGFARDFAESYAPDDQDVEALWTSTAECLDFLLELWPALGAILRERATDDDRRTFLAWAERRRLREWRRRYGVSFGGATPDEAGA